MRLGYVVSSFAPLSETFIRREVLALCDLGHSVVVYARQRVHDPQVGQPLHPNLRVRQVDHGHDPRLLAQALVQDLIEHVHGTLMLHSQMAAYQAARIVGIPFSITAYSGHSVFTASDRRLYHDLSRDPLASAIVVEDPVMRDWLIERLGADPERIVQIANSLDLAVYRPCEPSSSARILAIARFVEKKGLVHLIRAFHAVASDHPTAQLQLVGSGPDQDLLRHEARAHPRIEFSGTLSETECRQAYASCQIFCLPAVRAGDGDADGIPTTVLEAMAMARPVVVSDLLSAPHYVRHGQEGLLVAPHDEAALAESLLRLLGDAPLRSRLGSAGRRRVEALCDLRRNVLRLEQVFVEERTRRWCRSLESLPLAAPQRIDTHSADSSSAVPQSHASCLTLSATAALLDRVPLRSSPVAPDGRLDLGDASVDSVVIADCLPFAFDPRRVVDEAARVLRAAGRLRLHEPIAAALPDALNRLGHEAMLTLLDSRFEIDGWRIDDGRALHVDAHKRESTQPLVSVVIPTYNRARFIVRAIESVLQQHYPSVEVVVVDDGSTDGTAALLERYRSRIRLVRHAENRGIAAAKNSGLRATSPQAAYVAILDSDDFYLPQFLERCVRHLQQHAEIGLVYSDYSSFDESGRKLADRPGIEPWSVSEWLRTCNLFGDTWVARRSLVMQTDLHDESMTCDVDYDLFYQLLEITSFAHVAEPLVCYTTHGEQYSLKKLEMARAHAANLVKYGHSPEYAYLRARRNPEWIPAIEEGIALGRVKHAERACRKAEAAARLAIDGGRPVRNAYLVFGAPSLGEEEIAEISATIRSGWIGSGPRATRFEHEFAAYTGATHAIALNSCTAGLFLALVACGIGSGDEVITTPLTFAATVNVIEHAGATPVFADIDPQTLNLDPAAVERAITPRTRAIIAVHFGGLPCALDRLQVIASAHRLELIEDAAHATGARHEGVMIGGHGRLTAFSFYANKNLTTGEGGMLTTVSGELADRLRTLRLHGLSADAWARFHDKQYRPPSVVEPGYKFNMPDLAAALGLPQLRKLERHLLRREAIAASFDQGLAGLPLQRQLRGQGATRHSLHLYPLLLDPTRWRMSRDRVVEALRAENIGATVHYRPVHQEPYYRRKYGVSDDSLPVACAVGARILTLPISPAMNDGDAADVIRAMRKVAAAGTR